MIAAWLRIAFIDALMGLRGFSGVYRFVRKIAFRGRRGPRTPVELCDIIDRAAVYYPRQLHCLRRSAAMTWLLRAHGHPAEMIVGASVTPFFAHAWVELDGHIIGDDERMVRERYTVLERCPAEGPG
jgi:hypothetical protein